MTIRLVKKFQRESEAPAVEVTKPVSCAKTVQTWVDEFRRSKRTGASLAGLLKFGAPQIQSAGDCSCDERELGHLKKAS